MTNLHYLKFDFNEWLSGSIQCYDNDIKALFIDLCSIISRSGGSVFNDKKLQMRLHLNETTLNERLTLLIDGGIVVNDGGDLSIKFISQQIIDYENLCQQNQRNRQKGIKKKGASTIKNRIEENRIEENKESKDARANLLSLIDPYKKRYPMPEDEYKKFIGYWLAVNDINEIPRFENDRYFNIDTKLANWYGNWKKASTANGSPDLKIAKLNLPEGF